MKAQRRQFLQSLAAGGLLLALPLAAHTQGSAGAAPAQLAGWVRIGADGVCTVLSNVSEIGQGTGTALAQILANELDLDWRSVRLEPAPLLPEYANALFRDYGTYGSGGVRGNYAQLRVAGAKARAMLIAAAARRWGVAVETCDTGSGHVTGPGPGQRVPYAALAAEAARLPVPQDAPLMPRARWRHIGQDAERLDLPAKVDGSAVYGVDVVLPDMLVATIVQCPAFGGKLRAVDPAPALAVNGVRKVVRLADAVAVVATGYWNARKGLAALQPEWDLQSAGRPDTPRYTRMLADGAAAGGTVYARRDTTIEATQAAYDKARLGAAASHDALYTAPFLAHATMEPMNATARVNANSAELWLPTQTPVLARKMVATALGLPLEAVTIHVTLSGGGFGRRVEFDFAVQAARIAREAGAPVKLIWSREEDMKHGFYRPAAAIRLRADLDAAGMPLAVRFDSACEAISRYVWGGTRQPAQTGADFWAVGSTLSYYAIPALLHTVNTVDIGVPVGVWRSVSDSQNCFACESFIDELAHRARIEPVAFRRRLLAPNPRELAVLDALRWEVPTPAGRHRGMAMVRSNGTVVALAVEISVTAEKTVRVHAVQVALDCGVAVNPRNIRAQVEGSIAFGMSAAFFGEITLKDGAVQQSNFHDYPLLALAQMPRVGVRLVESAQMGGAGEEAVGPLAPAIANAL
ncbi:MAG TPA: molybdopterin cofactor-binding domain-containing protein, partial [Burkholderiaceae bacterium]